MKKIIIFALMNLIFISCAYSQTGWHSFSFPSSSETSEYISEPSFVNAETGYVINGATSPTIVINLFKTTNKGISWVQKNAPQPPTTSTGLPVVLFLNENTGFIVTAYLESTTYLINVIKTTNGGTNWCTTNSGANWCSYSSISGVTNVGFLLNPHLNFVNNNIGYIWFDKGIIRTTDGGSTWNHILSSFGYQGSGQIRKVVYDKNNTNILYVAGGLGVSNAPGQPVLYKSTNQGSNFQILADGQSIQNGVRGIYDATMLNSDKLVFATTTGISKYENGNFSTVSEPLSSNSYNYYRISGYGNRLIVYLEDRYNPDSEENKILYSDDAGITWNTEISFTNRLNGTFNFSSVLGFVSRKNTDVYASYKTFFYAREMPVSGQLLFDNVPQSSTTPFYINDFTGNQSLLIPAIYSVLGGTLSYHVGYSSINSGQQIFYKWQNGATMSSSSDYIDNENYYIKANYKSKNVSTDNTAISKAASTKTLKEAHGYIDRVHTSLGGVFFSRSTNDGYSFSQEEVVNDNWGSGSSAIATTENKNPQLAEVKTILSGGVDAGKNSAVVWERRTGNIINIMYSQREVIGSAGVWGMNGIGVSGSNSFTVDVTGYPSFQCLPKLSVIKVGQYSDLYFTVITYLKPDGSSNKLMARVLVPGEYPQDRVISAGNISDFAIYSKPKTSVSGHDIYFAFKRDHNIFYKNANFYISGSTFVTDSTQQFKVSGGDGNISYRFSPDISLRNGYPIITYQGQSSLVRDYSIENPLTGFPTPYSVTLNMNPIIVRWANSNGWNGNIMTYNSNGTDTQQNPDIEGCSNANAYILAYSKNNTEFKNVVKGDNIGNYYCDPPTFSGTDEKLVQGSYISATGSISRVTLTPSNTVYSLGQSDIDITDSYLPIYDNAYSNVKGIVDYNETIYTFDLGPIIIKSNWIGETSEILLPPEIIPVTNSADFNEYMTSDLFSLKNEDTLILGTSACHSKPSSYFEPLVYRINLLDVNDVIVRELFVDTVQSEEEIMTEYYRGFIMDNIDGTQSFRIQLHLENMNGRDAAYTFSGVYNGDVVSERGGGSITNGIYVDYKQRGNPSSIPNTKPTEYILAQNYPNPFNPSTTIKYSIPNDGLVQIKIYDIAGKEVMNLVNENKTAGNYEVKFNGANLSSGIYFYRINAGEFVQTKRMVLVK